MSEANSKYDEFIDSEEPTPQSSKYDSVIEEQDLSDRQELWAGASLAVQTDPDKYARLRSVAKSLELDPSVFGKTIDTSSGAGAIHHAESVAALNKMGLDKFHFQTPRVATWLSNIENMQLAHDDVTSGNFEQFVKSAWAGLDQITQARYINSAMEAGKDPDLDPRIGEFGASINSAQLGAEGQSLAPRVISKNLQTLGPMAGTLAFGVGVGSVAAASAVATGAPELAPVAFGVGTALGSGWATKQLEQAGAYVEYVHEMKARGVPVDLRRAKKAAEVVGAINGIIEVGGFALALKFMPGIKIIFQEGAPKVVLQASIRRLVAKAILGYGAELASESAQEGVQDVSKQIGKDVLLGDQVNFVDLSKTFVDTSLSSVEAFALIGAGGTGLSLQQQVSARAAGERNAQRTESYARAVTASKLANRAPDKMGEVADLAVEDGHPTHAYLGTEEFTTLFQSKKIDPTDAAKAMGIGEEFESAVKEGTDIAIPFNTFISKIANSQYMPALSGDIKWGIDDMSAKEMEVFDANFDKLKVVLDEIKDKESDTSKDLRSHPAYEIVKKQLLEAGHDETESDYFAMVQAAFSKTMGVRNQVDVLQDFPLVVTSESQAVGNLDQSAYQGSAARELVGGAWSDEYLGSGEDTMGQGAGHYFTSVQSVAEWYRQALASGQEGWIGRMTEEMKARYRANPSQFDSNAIESARYWTGLYGADAALQLKKEIARLESSGKDQNYKEIHRMVARDIANLEAALPLVESGYFERVYTRPGNVFVAEIPEDSQLASWDRGLTDQKTGVGVLPSLERAGLIDRVVKAQMEREGEDLADIEKYQDARAAVENMTYSDFYSALSESIRAEMVQSLGADSILRSDTLRLNPTMIKRGNLRASELLRDAGIPGHTYRSNSGNQNFVMYDTSKIELVSTLYQAAIRSGEQLNRTVHEIRNNIGEDKLVVGAHADGVPMPSVVDGKILDRDLEQAETTWTEDQIAGVPQRIFDEAVAETSRGREVVDSIGEKMAPRDAAFWTRALRLPDRARFWYEISAAYFRRVFPDMTEEELSRFIDVVAATSPNANPYDNVGRAVGVMSESLQHIPVASDVISASAVSKALSGVGLEGAKVRSFSGTMQYILGLSSERPMSTNDRQVAASFGIGPDKIASNPVLYEVLSRFYIKMRDELNSKLPPGSEPYQTWQVQALGWVQERMESEKRGGSLKTETSDDYRQALGRLIDKMGRAGVRVENGTISVDALADPSVPDVVSGTRRDYLDSPIATVEVQSLLTKDGPAIAETLSRARASGDENSVREFDAITQRALGSLGRRLGKDPSLAERIASAVSGKKISISRVVTGYGTYDGAVGANVRLPVGQLTEPQLESFLSIIGEAWQQGAMAASSFREVEDPSVAPWPGWARTYQVFLEGRTEITHEQIAAFSGALGGNGLNVNPNIANGITVDINPLFGEDGPIAPTPKQVEDAGNKVFGDFTFDIIAKNYKSTYIERADYPAKVQAHGEETRSKSVRSIVGKSGLDSDLVAKYLDTSGPAAAQKVLDRAASKGQRAGARRSGDVSSSEQARAEKVRAEYRTKVSGLKSLQSETAQVLSGYESELVSKWKPRAEARFAANEKARAAVQARNQTADAQYVASDSPTRPVSDRWTADRGAIPGEPMMTLDEKPDGSFSAALVEVTDRETAEVIGVVAAANDGNYVGPIRKTAEAASVDAEEFVAKPQDEAIQGRGPVFIGKPRHPMAAQVAAVHYSSQPNLTEIDPRSAGTGSGGTERRRFGPGNYGKQGGVAARAYFYVREGGALPAPEKTVASASAYQVVLANMYDLRTDPLGIVKQVGTANLDKLEEAISAAGFDGRISDAGPGFNSPFAVVFGLPDGVTVPVEPAVAAQEQVILNQPSRGSITLMANGRPYQISLGATKDRSTFLHELGHMFIDITGRVAQEPGTSQQTKDDYDVALKWMGYQDHSERVAALEEMATLTKTGSDKSRLDALIAREERWAQGFESFLMDGKAPSPELIRPFIRFARWLGQIYGKIKGLVDLPDEITQVMQRMIATDEQISQVENHDQYIPMFENAKEAGMTEERFKRYQEIAAEAHLEAYRQVDLQIKMQQDRETKSWWKDEKAKTRGVVTSVIDAKPSVRASQFFRDGTIPPDVEDSSGILYQEGSPVKLSASALDNMYGTQAAAIKRRLGDKAVVKVGGVHPDEVASAFQFKSGDEMVRAMVNEPTRARQIAEETKRRMVAAHGDIMKDGTIEFVSREAVHDSAGHLKMLQTELDSMNRQAGQPVVKLSKTVLSGYAETQILGATVRQVDPNRYLQSERKAATEAQRATRKGKFDEAVQWQKKRMINRYLYSAAMEARKKAESGIKFLARQNRDDARRALGLMDTVDPQTNQVTHSYLQQQDKLLERFELRKVSAPTVKARQSLAEWIQRETEANRDPVVPQNLLDESQRMNYADMKLADFLDLVDTVKNIKKQSDRKRRLKVGAEEVMFDAFVEEGAAQIAVNGGSSEPTRVSRQNRTWAERAIFDPIRGLDAELVRLREVANQLDGDDPNGLFHRILIHPLDDAAVSESEMNVKVTALILKALQELSPVERALLGSMDTIKIPSIGDSVLMSDLITVGLQSGNVGNEFKLLAGWQTNRQGVTPWTVDTLSEMKSQLGEEHWDLIQKIWDALETLWPEASALEKRMTGLDPKKVEAKGFSITLPDGTTKAYRGGYYPIIYDPLFSGRNLQAPVGVGGTLYSKDQVRAVTPNGHLQDRIDNYARPISLRLDGMVSHITSVIHDTTHRESLISAWRFMADQRIADAMIRHMGEEYYRMVLERLRRVAQARNQPSKFLNIMHRGTAAVSASMMGFKMSVSLQNIANFVLAKQAVGTVPLAQAMVQYAGSPIQMTKTITALSGVMRHRMQNRDNELRQAYQVMLGLDTTRRKRAQHEVVKMGYRFMAMTNAISEFPTWLAAFQSASKTMTEQEAVRAADDVIISTFGGGNVKDLALVQDNEIMKPFTMFYGFFSSVYNMTRRAGRISAKQWRSGQKGKAVAGSLEYVLWNIVVMNAMSELFSGRGPDDDPEDDPKDRMKTWAAWSMAKGASYTFAMVPFVRDIYRMAESGRREASLTPLTSIATEVGRTAQAVGKAGIDLWDADEIDSEMLAELGGNIGSGALKSWAIYEGMPVSQFNITTGFLWDWLVNENSPENWSEGVHDLLFTKRRNK